MTNQPTRLVERAPVRQATIVRSDVEHTFDVFVRTIGQWWPVVPISSGKERVRDVVAEPGVGGRLYELWDDGTTRTWGKFVAWDPPRGFVMTWHASAEPTEVELTFTSLGPALTRVAVEHRGWEALSEAQTHEDCAVPGAGGYAEGSYDWGWTKILANFAAQVDESTSAGRRTTQPSVSAHKTATATSATGGDSPPSAASR